MPGNPEKIVHQASFLEFERLIQREAGLYGNGALTLEWIVGRLSKTDSFRERQILGERALWILENVSPHLVQTDFVKQLVNIPLPRDIKYRLQALRSNKHGLFHQPGVVGCLLMARGAGRGFVQQFQVAKRYDRTTHQSTRLGESMQMAIQNALRLINQMLGCDSCLEEEDLVYGFMGHAVGPIDYNGNSIGFSAVLALASLFSGRLLDGIYASGALTSTGQARRVGGVAEKVRAALREHPQAKKILLPRQCQRDLSGFRDNRICFVDCCEELIEEAFGESLSLQAVEVEPERLLSRIHRLCREERRFVDGMKLAKRAFNVLKKDSNRYERFQAGWYLVDCLIHLGRLDEAERVLRRVEKDGRLLLKQHRVRPAHLLQVRMNRGRIAWGRFDHAVAAHILEQLIVEMKDMGLLAEEEGRFYGTLGQVYTHAGNFAKAEKALLVATRKMEHIRAEIPREHQMLGDLYRRMGRWSLAEQELQLAERLNNRVSEEGIRCQNSQFILLAQARLARARGEWQRVEKISRQALALSPPYHPRAIIERELGVALWHVGKRKEAIRVLEGAPEQKPGEDYDALAMVIAVSALIELVCLLAAEKPIETSKRARRVLVKLSKLSSITNNYGPMLKETITAIKTNRNILGEAPVGVLNGLLKMISW